MKKNYPIKLLNKYIFKFHHAYNIFKLFIKKGFWGFGVLGFWDFLKNLYF